MTLAGGPDSNGEGFAIEDITTGMFANGFAPGVTAAASPSRSITSNWSSRCITRGWRVWCRNQRTSWPPQRATCSTSTSMTSAAWRRSSGRRRGSPAGSAPGALIHSPE